MATSFLSFYSRHLTVLEKLRHRGKARPLEEQINIKSGGRASFGIEFALLKAEERKKIEKMYFLAPPGLVCRRRFRCVTMDVLGVESLVEQDCEG